MKTVTAVILLFIMVTSCKEKYEILPGPQQSSFLVVDGSIVTNGITKISLSRTTSLAEKNILFENGAEVNIESDNNITYPLTEKDSGRYELPFLNLDVNAKYRINIKTKDDREYVSDYVQVIKTPDVDTITWTRYKDGVEIYVNTKDPENNTQYYRFEYEESWEFLSPYKQKMYATVITNPDLFIKIAWSDSATFSYNDSMDNCWQFRNSSKILLATTTQLSQNLVYMPLVYYPRGSWEFSHLYSINVKQYGLSKEEYDFLAKMKKNTESLGTIFDPLPSELSGNFRCLTDTSEKIIGFVGATRIKEKRAFIDNKDLVNWDYREGCKVDTIVNSPGTLIKYFYDEGAAYDVIEPVFEGQQIVAYYITSPICLDCRLRGINTKPVYWR